MTPLRPGDYVVGVGGCWIWQLKRCRGGYGRCRREGRAGGTQQAHRWYYEQLVGPIPDGHQLDHLCRNRACVNPSHMEPVSHAENTRRGDRTKLTWAEVDEIRALPVTNRAASETFGVSIWHVEKIRAGTRWSA